MAVRIATWNLDRAATAWRREAIRTRLAEIGADIWVLTETRDSVSPGAGFGCIARSGQRTEHAPDEAWVSIWSRLPLVTPRASSDPVHSAAATVALPDGTELTLFGTVLPWRGRSWRGLPSAQAVAFQAALAAQQADWTEAAVASAGAVCVAGDFNQDLSDRSYYWSRKAHAALTLALDACGLVATTAGAADPVRALTSGKAACIDHICVSSSLAPGDSGLMHAGLPLANGRSLSDHPVVWLDLPGC